MREKNRTLIFTRVAWIHAGTLLKNAKEQQEIAEALAALRKAQEEEEAQKNLELAEFQKAREEQIAQNKKLLEEAKSALKEKEEQERKNLEDVLVCNIFFMLRSPSQTAKNSYLKPQKIRIPNRKKS